ncbi:MAG: sensor histidine kinase [Arcobacter sp.]|uniref:sensor histidine kinase n=1 Tax=Arcobacter sp. TaxID=1872629 RepID=UPI003CFECF1F
MHNPTSKTIVNVLILYLCSSFLLVSFFAYIYYDYQKEIYKEKEFESMKIKAQEFYSLLQDYHESMSQEIEYPKFDDYNSAIFDIDKNIIFSTIKNKNIDLNKIYYQKNPNSYFIYEMKPYYMGAAFIVIEQETKFSFKELSYKIVSFSIIVILLIVLTSLFLVKLILKPLRQNAALLNRFIKDTTHELNTPISTILTNIELLEKKEFEPSVEKKLKRVKMASLTISNLYEDLVFLLLNHKISSQNQLQNINEIIENRIEYFNLLFSAKKLKVDYIQNDKLEIVIDKKKIIRVIDNIISNAIKYTNENTTITVEVNKNSISFIDQGIGMSEAEIKDIFKRYTRFNNIQNGFGLGYNIVYSIAKEYNIDIKIDSKIDEGTCVKLNFS